METGQKVHVILPLFGVMASLPDVAGMGEKCAAAGSAAIGLAWNFDTRHLENKKHRTQHHH